LVESVVPSYFNVDDELDATSALAWSVLYFVCSNCVFQTSLLYST
jgi:hypothetical protein